MTYCMGGDGYVESWIDVSGNPERPVYYWVTSGTTGEPKVVIENIGQFNVASTRRGRVAAAGETFGCRAEGVGSHRR